jgi:hypothetical protein
MGCFGTGPAYLVFQEHTRPVRLLRRSRGVSRMFGVRTGRISCAAPRRCCSKRARQRKGGTARIRRDSLRCGLFLILGQRPADTTHNRGVQARAQGSGRVRQPLACPLACRLSCGLAWTLGADPRQETPPAFAGQKACKRRRHSLRREPAFARACGPREAATPPAVHRGRRQATIFGSACHEKSLYHRPGRQDL